MIDINTIAILEKQEYARSQEYRSRLIGLEDMMGFFPNEKKYKQEYADLVTTYGSRTPKSYALLQAVEKEEEHAIMSSKHLDNKICDIADVPTKGETKMPLLRRRVLIGFHDDGKPIHKQIQTKNVDEENDRIVQAYVDCGRIWEFITAEESKPQLKTETNFQAYATSWMNTCKNGKCQDVS